MLLQAPDVEGGEEENRGYAVPACRGMRVPVGMWEVYYWSVVGHVGCAWYRSARGARQYFDVEVRCVQDALHYLGGTHHTM